jgi:hypothetical protein
MPLYFGRHKAHAKNINGNQIKLVHFEVLYDFDAIEAIGIRTNRFHTRFKTTEKYSLYI